MVGTIANRIDGQFEMFLCSKRVEGVTDSTLSGYEHKYRFISKGLDLTGIDSIRAYWAGQNGQGFPQYSSGVERDRLDGLGCWFAVGSWWTRVSSVFVKGLSVDLLGLINSINGIQSCCY